MIRNWVFSGERPALALRQALVALFVCCATHLSAHGRGQPDTLSALDRNTQKSMIDSLSAVLQEEYIFPAVAQQMEALLRKNMKAGAYTAITNPDDFAGRLTKDLQSVSHDKHLRVRYLPPGSQREEAALPEEAQRRRRLEQLRAENFGFRKVEILPGNIGYIDFRFFAEAKDAAPTAIAAMNFLAYTDAIIFDLRQNGGGNPSMIQLISSYLFEESVHLNSFYIRKGASTQQFWTQESVPGPKMTAIPVYILTSSFTFSGAEEFAYNLKNLKRGTIIGETTGGGAHPVNLRAFPSLNFAVAVPFGRAVNPVTGTNWEGAGVSPDIKAAADDALLVARTEALKQLAEKTTDKSGKDRLTWLLDGLAVERHPVTASDSVLLGYAGTFGPRTIRFEKGALYYKREGRPEFKLIPMGGDRFMVESLAYFRIQFRRDNSGKVSELIGQYDNGETDSNLLTR